MAMNSYFELNLRAHVNSKEYYEDRIIALEKAFLNMYRIKLKTDVEIYLKTETPDSRYFKAHKLILAARSPVFADLFWNTSNSTSEVVEVDGVTSSGLELLLEYIYNDDLETKTVDELMEVAKAALRFKVTGVVRNCKHQIIKYPLSIDNVFSVLEATRYFKMESMHDKCMHFIKGASQELLFKAPGFLELTGLSVYNVLKQRDTTSGCEALALERVISWIVYNKIKGRKLLSEINILSLTSAEFLNIIEKFPNFFTHREIASVLSNLLRQGCMELPEWCRSRESFVSETLTRQSIVSKSIQFKTDCSKSFTKSNLYGEDGFRETITFELKLSNKFPERIYLTMLELAFGSSYVPLELLKLELFRFGDGPTIVEVGFRLEATNDHHYIILSNRLKMARNYPFVFQIIIQVNGLKRWGLFGPVSNRKYRVAQVPEDIFCNMRLNSTGYDPICLTPLSNWLLILDPARNEKRFLLPSFYFDL